ncbi:MAG: LLM class F420-dependent oxidoreductase [Alphaproteobacteria bacterium]|nr:LLM class F420-dependent oxidoreductase [Alphaproteobacteria bacterium]
MKFGFSFPTAEIGNDPGQIRDVFQTIEGLGYDFVTMPEHVLGARDPVADDWRAYYTRERPFHEPFVLYGFAAAVTTTLELATAILILPQRQTALVAKQAAELDVVSGGRARLGVGIGWNEIEFDVLGENYRNRARRMEEQVAVLRRLWTEELVTFEGEWHRLDDVGINPMPVQRPIPLWVGAFQPPAIARAGRIGDGWYLNPRQLPDDETRAHIATFHAAAREAGRDPASLGMDATIWSHEGTPDDWRRLVADWRALGVSHITFRTMQADLPDTAAHLAAAKRFREAVADA